MTTETASKPAAIRSKPPFRAEQVGSLLRPAGLKAARERILGPHTAEANVGPHDNAELRAIEDGYIRDTIAMQERVGLKVVTDGELRRRSFMLELLLSWEGLSANRAGLGALKWRNDEGANDDMTSIKITGPIRWRPGTTVEHFKFLKANTNGTPRVALPAPNLVHYFLVDGGNLDATPYRTMDEFWNDLIAAYRQELKALVAAGATSIQFDDVCFGYLCDPVHRNYVTARGDDPDRLLHTYAQSINACIADVPDHVTVMVHTCRGNREGRWVAAGAYDPVADILFNETKVGGFLLEYDTDRAGGFGPLRYLPKGKTAVLGLVSTKKPELESIDLLMRRIEQAAQVVSVDQLGVSPQCGFASSYRGNPLSLEEQEAKLRRVVEVAERVWGHS